MIDPPPSDEHAPQWPPPPEPGDGQPPKWWRSPENRYLGGVAGGLGERFDVDPLFIRVALVVATLVGAGDDGFSVVPLLYGLAWVCLSVDHERPLLSRVHEPAARRETAGAMALVLSAAVLLPRLGPGGSTELRIGVVLLGLAVLLLSSRGPDEGGSWGPGAPTDRRGGSQPYRSPGGDRSTEPDAEPGRSGGEAPAPPTFGGWPSGSAPSRPEEAPPGETSGDVPDQQPGRRSPASGETWNVAPARDSPAPGGAVGAMPDRSSGWQSTASAGGVSWTGRRWAPSTRSSRPDRPRRPPKRAPALWPLTLALLALVAVVWVLIDVGLGFAVRPGLASSVALLVVGGVLGLGAWRGHARSTILVGLALLPLWFAFRPGDVERFDGTGERIFRPQTVDEADGGHELGYGRLVLDLRDVDLGPGEVLRTGVSLTAGVARVIVPADAELEVIGRVGMGSITIETDDPWRFHDRLAVDRTVDWASGPQPRHCDTQAVDAYALSFTNGSFASVDDLAAELERRGWDPPSRPRFDEDYGYDVVSVAVDRNGALCDPSIPDLPADPATVIVDLNLGLADLEVTRVPVD